MMATGTMVRWGLGLALAGAGIPAVGQASTPPQTQGGCYDQDANGKQVFLPNCGLPAAPPRSSTPATGGASDPAKSFPFPGEPANQAEPTGSPQAPTAGGAASGEPANPAKAFPFPGEDNTPLVRPDGSVVAPPAAGAAPAGSAGGLKDAGSSGSSSSGSSSSSSSESPLSGLPDDGTGKGPLAEDPDAVLKKPHRKAPAPVAQTPSEREAEDLSVAAFYMDDSNWRGAYLRATDAVSVAKDDPNAHFALAEAARKLGKLDEAEKEYKQTLTLDPVPKQKKAAEKALKEMAGG